MFRKSKNRKGFIGSKTRVPKIKKQKRIYRYSSKTRVLIEKIKNLKNQKIAKNLPVAKLEFKNQKIGKDLSVAKLVF